MKNTIFVCIVLILTNFCIANNIWDDLWKFLWNKLREINQNNYWKDFNNFISPNTNEKKDIKITKKISVWYFCYIISTYKDDIYSYSFQNFDPTKSIFLKLLCKETWIYNNRNYIENIELNQNFIENLKQIWEGKINWIFSNCKLKWYNLIPDSLNNVNFACISKKIFDLVAEDTINLMSMKAYWYSSKQENINKWQLSYFGDSICKNWKYLNWEESNKPSLCNHPLTLKYLKNISNKFKNLARNLQIIKLEDLDINSFLSNLWYKTNLKKVPTLIWLKDQLYNELYFYNLFLSYYKAFLKNKTNKAELIKVWTNVYNITKYNIDNQILQATDYQVLSQTVIWKSIVIIKDIYRTFPVHIGFLAILEDLNAFRQALAKIYTPIDQLRYKLENVQDLDKK